MSAVGETVGLLHYPAGLDAGIANAGRRTLRRTYCRAIAYRANLRTPEYMTALLEESHPGAALVRTSDSDWEERVASCQRLILLYPDSIGIGWRPVERRLARSGPARRSALNGRRRSFELDSSTLRQLRRHRLLERSMVGEAVALALLAIATPSLAVWDLLRGRR